MIYQIMEIEIEKHNSGTQKDLSNLIKSFVLITSNIKRKLWAN